MYNQLNQQAKKLINQNKTYIEQEIVAKNDLLVSYKRRLRSWIQWHCRKTQKQSTPKPHKTQQKTKTMTKTKAQKPHFSRRFQGEERQKD